MNSFNPQVGDRCTYCIGSDRYSVTVVKRTNFSVETTDDKSRQIGDYHGKQRWISVPNPNGVRRKFTRRSNGIWLSVGNNFGRLTAGSDPHRDPSF